MAELAAVSEASVDAEAEQIRSMRCPRCGKNGGVDMHKSVFVWSAIIFTRFHENKYVSCASCARKKQALDTLGTAAFGWWGIPFGLIGAPTGIVMNLAQMISSSVKTQPSRQLREYARDRLARNAQQ